MKRETALFLKDFIWKIPQPPTHPHVAAFGLQSNKYIWLSNVNIENRNRPNDWSFILEAVGTTTAFLPFVCVG